jgi:hypothetical protein
LPSLFTLSLLTACDVTDGACNYYGGVNFVPSNVASCPGTDFEKLLKCQEAFALAGAESCTTGCADPTDYDEIPCK